MFSSFNTVLLIILAASRQSAVQDTPPAKAQEIDVLLAEADVEGVGFGFVYLRRTDAPSDILCEDLRHGFSDPLGDEALAYFDRLAWLREHDVLASRFTVRPDTALERVVTELRDRDLAVTGVPTDTSRVAAASTSVRSSK